MSCAALAFVCASSWLKRRLMTTTVSVPHDARLAYVSFSSFLPLTGFLTSLVGWRQPSLLSTSTTNLTTLAGHYSCIPFAYGFLCEPKAGVEILLYFPSQAMPDDSRRLMRRLDGSDYHSS